MAWLWPGLWCLVWPGSWLPGQAGTSLIAVRHLVFSKHLHNERFLVDRDVAIEVVDDTHTKYNRWSSMVGDFKLMTNLVDRLGFRRVRARRC